MKKYKVNVPVVLRNVAILFWIGSCALANKQLANNEIRLKELDNECQMALIQTKHSLKAKLLHQPNKVRGDVEIVAQGQPRVEENKIYLGNFKITHYCACKKCCGPNAQGITASGKRVQEGKTIAVDTKVIKMGSQVEIADYGTYEAQDTGSAIKGNKIDVYIADHQRALQMGVTYKDVWLVKGV